MKTYNKIALAASVVAAGGLAFVGTSMARGGFQKGHGMFGGASMIIEQLDADENGELSRAEIDSGLESRIANADANGDGNVDLEEFQPLFLEIIRSRMVDGFQKLDADGDAVITPEEFQGPINRIMSRLDRDEDGTLSAEEMQMRRHGRGHGEGRRHRDDGHDNR